LQFFQSRDINMLEIKEAIKLHFEDGREELADYAPNPTFFTMMDLGEIHV
jgi:hypothetical protein